jgi:periplasmic protein TonB
LQRLLALADRERIRFSIAVVLAAALCLVLLGRSVGWMSSREPAPHAPATMEMRLVELAPPAPVAPAAHAQAAPPAQAAKRTLSETHAQQQPLAHAVPPRNSPAPAPQPREAARLPTEPATNDQPATPSAPAAAVAHAGSSATATSSNGTASAAPPAPSGSTQARLLSQPMPVLPDDLREQGYQVTAVAHFKVHADGTFEVELVKPTQNPRLNQILLETLHRWRFFPALENGHPVESDQDVRVHFSVS